jgi:hypothetical protein
MGVVIEKGILIMGKPRNCHKKFRRCLIVRFIGVLLNIPSFLKEKNDQPHTRSMLNKIKHN